MAIRRRFAVACLVWPLAACAAFAQSFPNAPYPVPYPAYGAPQPQYDPAYYLPMYQPMPAHAPSWPMVQRTGLPQPMSRGIPIMPAPPVFLGPGATVSTAPKPAPPPSEVLPPPRELDPKKGPGLPYGEIVDSGPGSMMIRDDGKPDMAPHCPPNAPRGYLYYGRAEYLMWWGQHQTAPVLLTEGVPAATLVGNGDVALIAQTRQGGRFTLGRWLDNSQSLAIEAVGFFIGGDESIYERNSTGAPVLARPFVNGITGLPAQSLVATPGFPGMVQIGMLSRLWGLETNARCEMCRWGWGHVDALAGVRYLEFDENLTILAGTNTGPATANFVFDGFGARNRFLGCQAGVESEIYYRKFFVDAWAKLAIGDNHELVEIQGNRVLGGRVVAGGLLAQPSNIGRHRRDQFGYVPEVCVNVGYQAQVHLRATVGYNFLLLGQVARPGDQIDTRVNTTGAGPAAPAFPFNQGEFWIHGLIAGFEYRF